MKKILQTIAIAALAALPGLPAAAQETEGWTSTAEPRSHDNGRKSCAVEWTDNQTAGFRLSFVMEGVIVAPFIELNVRRTNAAPEVQNITISFDDGSGFTMSMKKLGEDDLSMGYGARLQDNILVSLLQHIATRNEMITSGGPLAATIPLAGSARAAQVFSDCIPKL